MPSRPDKSGRHGFFNSAGSFKITKAVKLGRGSTYNSTVLQQINGSQSKTSCTVTACSAGQYFNESSCSCSPCPSGEDCVCSSHYGANYVSDGQGGCKYDGICPAGQYLDYFGSGCLPCPDNAVCDGSQTWKEVKDCSHDGCIGGGQPFECK